MIEIKNVSKNFGKVQALKKINLQMVKGAGIALIGPNGCGKTTLIKSILGMVIPTEGDIICNGQSVKNNHSYRSQIGYMPQIGRYPENMNVGQVFALIKALRKDYTEEYDEELVESYQLKSIFDKNMKTLSGGTTQKVSAAISFLFKPDILILDEPTAGLDPLASEILKEKIIKERNKGKLVIITSHLLAELDELINEIVFMQEGNLIFHKTIDEVRDFTGQDKISRAIASVLKAN